MVKSWFLGVYAASPTAILTLPLPHVLRSKRVKVTLNKALNKYDNLLLAGDLNINTLRPTLNLIRSRFEAKIQNCHCTIIFPDFS